MIRSTRKKNYTIIVIDRGLTREHNYWIHCESDILLQIFTQRVSEGLAELGHKAASEYVGQCSKLWSLLNSRALVKTEEVAQFKQVFGTSSLIPCCMVLMLLPLDQPLTHNHSKYGATTAYILNESSSTCRVMAFNYNQKVMKPDKSIQLIMYRTPYTTVRHYQ